MRYVFCCVNAQLPLLVAIMKVTYMVKIIVCLLSNPWLSRKSTEKRLSSTV